MFPHFSYIMRLLFPFSYPINVETLIFGGISKSIWHDRGILLRLIYLLLSTRTVVLISLLFPASYLRKILCVCILVQILRDTSDSILCVINYVCPPLVRTSFWCFVQLAAALWFYHKEFFFSRPIGIAFPELPSLAGGFRMTMKGAAIMSDRKIILRNSPQTSQNAPSPDQ